MNTLAGYIKLHRKIKNWRWKAHPPTLCLFIHLLVSASYETQSTENGITLRPGQLFISLNTLSKETGLTVDQIRTALSHLQQTREITVATSKGCRKTTITILNWDKYQLSQSLSQSDSQSSEQQETLTEQGFLSTQSFINPKVVTKVKTKVDESQSFSQSKSQSLSQSDSQSSEQPETLLNQDFPDADKNNTQSNPQSLSQSFSQSKSQTIIKNNKKDKNIKKNNHGEGGFVLLTDEEYAKLAAKFGEPFLAKCIEKLDNYIGSKGGKDPYKSHYYVINGWVKDEILSRYPTLIKPRDAKQTTTTTAPQDDPSAAWGGRSI